MCFVTAVLLGIAVTTPVVISVSPAIGIRGSVDVHLLSVAWVTQLIFGTVYSRGRFDSTGFLLHHILCQPSDRARDKNAKVP